MTVVEWHHVCVYNNSGDIFFYPNNMFVWLTTAWRKSKPTDPVVSRLLWTFVLIYSVDFNRSFDYLTWTMWKQTCKQFDDIQMKLRNERTVFSCFYNSDIHSNKFLKALFFFLSKSKNIKLTSTFSSRCRTRPKNSIENAYNLKKAWVQKK